ncbi:MAG TPA: beta-galactosidase, partial [Symbiobacteriaceae bacterium]|nr:beta-galactosidase [Symbiobacteriaceae bacterium]
MPQISYDSRALTINGKRTLLMSGAIHYPRSTPAMWPDLMRRSREAGLNCVETYVFWNLHERTRGVYDFSDRLDLLQFCRLAREHGLSVIVRIGPYICAETNYGGFPAWLRDIPGMQMRTFNQPFMAEMERWVRFITGYLKPMFAPNGGPIIAAQIENEYALVASTYGEEGDRYKQWAADLGRSLDLGVPWVMCYGGAEGAIETINGFYGHTQLERHWSDHPEQPALWTENWPGWYDTWGVPHHRRSPEDVAYAVARFVAAGGTGINYYMWHGGTNFGREAMYLQTTSYDFDAPLDEFGLPTTKSQHLARLNHLLAGYAPVLLSHGRPVPAVLGPERVAYKYGKLEFLCNDGDTPWAMGTLTLPPRSVAIAEAGKVRMVTCRVEPESMVVRSYTPASTPHCWVWQGEPLPGRRPEPPITAGHPIEQLALTRDESDYCWYTTRVSAAGGEATLTLEGVADYVYVYVDGQLAATTAGLLHENRGPFDGEAFTQTFRLTLTPGTHELAILCCALGLVKGDWQIGMANMAAERKGLWGR